MVPIIKGSIDAVRDQDGGYLWRVGRGQKVGKGPGVGMSGVFITFCFLTWCLFHECVLFVINH